MCRIVTGTAIHPLTVGVLPRFRIQDVMDILDLIISPNTVMHTLPPQGLQRIILVRQRHPAPMKRVSKKRLVRECVLRRRRARQLMDNHVIRRPRRVHDLQTTIRDPQTRRRGRGRSLREIRNAMLTRIRAVGRYPTRIKVTLDTCSVDPNPTPRSRRTTQHTSQRGNAVCAAGYTHTHG